MALQHARALLWMAEDLGFGGQRLTQKSFSAVVGGSQALSIITPSFLQSSTMPAQLLGTSYVATVQGLIRAVVNRSSKYFMTLTGTLQDTGSRLIQLPIPPMQILYLPTNLIGTSATLQADTAYTIPLPPGLAQSAIPKAAGTTTLHYDFLRES